MRLLRLLYRHLPHQCQLCLTPCNSYLCSPCCASLPRITHACDICALPLAHNAAQCGDCLKLAKPYRRTVCPLLYGYPLQRLLQEFKNQRPLLTLQALLPPLLEQLDRRYSSSDWPQMLVPVPMHWSKMLSRGFNQAHVLASALSQQSGIPCRSVLHRPMRLHNQKTLTRRQRFNNLTQAFHCPTDLSGSHVAVVDDVITTCATAMAAATTLQDAGAERVDVWALARTPSPG